MKLEDILRQAAQGLAAHRLRTTLSSIGIVFGVATVVAALAVGEGARREAAEQIGSLGINNVFVRAVHPADSAPGLTLADADALRSSVPGVTAVSVMRSTRTAVTASRHHKDAFVAGVNADWASVAGTATESGRWLIADDVIQRRRVTVLGAGLARYLFVEQTPVGQRISIGADWYEVVGVLSGQSPGAQAPAAAQRFDPNQMAVVPISAMDARLGTGDALDRVEEIGLRAAGPDSVQPAASAAAAIMDRRHPREAAYEVVVPRELLRARLRALRTFNIVLFSIGGLALLISGIGIMNIMLASVAERTAEIGVRRAFGATQRMVVAQFTVEAALLCGVGGVAGILVGVLLAQTIAWIAGWPIAVSIAGVAIALTMAAGVGLGFGIYPAHLAGSLDPAEALRAP